MLEIEFNGIVFKEGINKKGEASFLNYFKDFTYKSIVVHIMFWRR